MRDVIVVAEIEKTYEVLRIPTAAEAGVWRYVMWLPIYVKSLPFMAASDSRYPADSFLVGNFFVDFVSMTKATTYEECRTTPGAYFISGSSIFLHALNHRPPLVFSYTQYGQLYGFTNRTVARYRDVAFMPSVSSVPKLSEKIDPLEYGRMAFRTGSLTLLNTDRSFDEREPVFGNDMNLRVGEVGDEYDNLVPVAKYYIENYSFSLSKVNFSLKDKRELLSVKCPSATFDVATYPNAEDSVIGKIIPDAFGTCFGVPGICLNGKAGNVAKVFKLASTITSLSLVQVYKNELWVTVTPDAIDAANGTITLSVANAHVDGSYSNGIVAVKATGVFRPQTNPGDVIAKLNEVYGGITFTASNYKLAEWESELRPLAPVGLYMKEKKELSAWIELIQAGSTIGFQIITDYDKITARMDNPNRSVSWAIGAMEIQSVEDIEVDHNADKYASSAVIHWGHNEKDDSWKQVSNTSFRQSVLMIHRKESEYDAESLLVTETAAVQKAAAIMDDQKNIRPVFGGIRVSGRTALACRLYDIVTVDLSLAGINTRVPYIDSADLMVHSGEEEDVEYVHGASNEEEIVAMGIQEIAAIPGTYREFAGVIRGQITGREVDPESGQVALTIRQRDYSSVVASIIGG